jgi:hypothetical protein
MDIGDTTGEVQPIPIIRLDRVPANAKLIAVQGPEASLYVLKDNLGVLHNHTADMIVQINIQSALARGYWTAVDEDGKPLRNEE